MLTIPSDNQRTNKSIQVDFRGGMRRSIDPMNLGADEYYYMANARTRNGSIQTIKLPTNLSSALPVGKYQTLYGYGKYLIIFIAGVGYVRDYSLANPDFVQLSPFTFSPTVDNIFTASIESSWNNLRRVAITGNPSGSVNLTNSVNGTPSCLICQDGLNLPLLVFPNGTSRRANQIGDWSNVDGPTNEREYVPIGKQMLNFGGILYIVSPDGLEIYRSVTGRPLDFVVAVDTNGDKLPAYSSGIEAQRLSYRADFNPITCIAELPSVTRDQTEEAGFFVSTGQASYMIIPSLRDTLFNEPTFHKQFLFPTGPFNNFSVTDILGDTATINESGITSFNAVLQLKTEGENAPFHKDVFDLFEGITQQYTAAITSNNYGYFALNTIFGTGILVYDTLRAKWNSFDQYPEVVGYVKQFAEIKLNGMRKLFFITSSNQLFEMETSAQTALATIYTRELSALNNSEMELLPKRIRLVFDDILENGILTATEYVDHKKGKERTKAVASSTTKSSPPIVPPFGTNPNLDATTNITIPIELSRKGDKAGLLISWNFASELNKIGLVTESDDAATSEEDKGRTFATRKGTL